MHKLKSLALYLFRIIMILYHVDGLKTDTRPISGRIKVVRNWAI
jgi:hypothetical protein